MKAATVEFSASVGDTVVDKKTNIEGTVKTATVNRFDEKGYWLEAVDSTGRPFEHFVDERDLAGLEIDDRLG